MPVVCTFVAGGVRTPGNTTICLQHSSRADELINAESFMETFSSSHADKVCWQVLDDLTSHFAPRVKVILI
jgi:hypothetical protein